jgi:hypothetical protein
LAFSAPQPSSPSVTLSQADFDAVMAAIKQAREALIRSNLEIQKLSRRSTWQWILCGTLGVAVMVEGVALAFK